MKNFKFIAILYSVVFCVFTINSVLAFVPMSMLLEDTTLTEDNTAQNTFAASDVTLTINGGVTVGTASGNSQIDTASTNSSIIISGDALIRGAYNGIRANNSTGLYIYNDGSISTSQTRAINLLGSTNAEIINNTSGIISSETGNTIAASSGTISGATVTNSGLIYATSGTAITFGSTSSGTTLTNNSGARIYNGSSDETIRLGASSTLINSGTIENTGSPTSDAIDMKGNSNTVTFKDKGLVIGVIRSTGSNNTLKFQHGMGQSYYYETAGNDMTLEDLNGNQVVKGSAGSVGQGGNETQDELLGYKSQDIRGSLKRYKKDKNDLDNNKTWGETYISVLDRKKDTENLGLGFDLKNLSINLMSPLEESDFIFSIDTATQKFSNDHNINHYGFLSGINLNNFQFFNNLNSDTFLLGGITFHDSERTILTNTTPSGKLDIDDQYLSFKAIAGTKLNNKNLKPDIGFTSGLMLTPSHSESKIYKWETREAVNFSAYIEDEFIHSFNNEKSNLNLSWVLDYRSLLIGKDQKYKVNGTNATYTQKNDLTEELSFSANLGLSKKFFRFGILAFNIDGFASSQNTSGIKGNINYIFNF